MQYIKNQIELEFLSAPIRSLTLDAIQNAKSGHMGMPFGFADIMTVFLFEVCKKEDKIILSAGHGSMLLYSIYYLLGHKNYSINSLQNFRQLNSNTPGHPERNSDEIIMTTGPLAQGLATCVGLAIAAKKSNAKHKIYCIVGDGCLMEGLAYEAISIAGHLCLDNLIILFDSNSISIDGSTNLTISEDQALKFQAFNWQAEIANGHNLHDIRAAFSRSAHAKKPCFIEFKTIIGKFAPLNLVDSEKIHSGFISKENAQFIKKQLNYEQLNNFEVNQVALKLWRNLGSSLFLYNSSNNNAKSENATYDSKKTNIDDEIDKIAKNNILTPVNRKIFKNIVDNALSLHSKIILGSADLSESNCLKPNKYDPINKSNFFGNFIHYGAREHAMSAICNGLSIGGYIPICGTFFVFSDYMRPGIRLSSMMQLRVIYIFTHDSIGVGEDGPTHQPIEHIASFRSVPNLEIFRPFLAQDLCESIKFALLHQGPSMILLPRQELSKTDINILTKSLHNKLNDVLLTDNNLSYNLAGYVIDGCIQDEICIISTGLDVIIAIKVKNILIEHFNIKNIKIISIPSISLFDKLKKTKQQDLLKAKWIFTIELSTSLSLNFSFITINKQFSINYFGKSGKFEDLLIDFCMNANYIATEITKEINL